MLKHRDVRMADEGALAASPDLQRQTVGDLGAGRDENQDTGLQTFDDAREEEECHLEMDSKCLRTWGDSGAGIEERRAGS